MLNNIWEIGPANTVSVSLIGRGRADTLVSQVNPIIYVLQPPHQMREYCEETDECRHAFLLRYFGETWSQRRCGDRCDNCLPKPATSSGTLVQSKLKRKGLHWGGVGWVHTSSLRLRQVGDAADWTRTRQLLAMRVVCPSTIRRVLTQNPLAPRDQGEKRCRR